MRRGKDDRASSILGFRGILALWRVPSMRFLALLVSGPAAGIADFDAGDRLFPATAEVGPATPGVGSATAGVGSLRPEGGRLTGG